MLKFFSKISIKYQMLVLAVSTVLLVTAVFLVYYSENTDVLIKKNGEFMVSSVGQLKLGMENTCDTVSRNITSIAYTSFVQDFMMETDPLKKFMLDKQIANLLTNMKWNMGDSVLDIVIIGNSGSFSTLNGSYDFINSRREYFAGSETVKFSSIEDVSISNYTYKCIVAGMTARSIDRSRMTGREIGVVCVILDAAAMGSGLFGDMGNVSTQFYLLDSAGKIIASSAGDKAGSEAGILPDGGGAIETGAAYWTVDNEKALVQVEPLASLGGYVIGLTGERALLGELGQIRSRMILTFLAVILVLGFPFAVIVRNILRPLREFTLTMGRISVTGLRDPANKLSLKGFSEIELVAGKFNEMIAEIEQLTERLVESNTQLYKAELEKKRSELAFLQSQINPHFLYNTLEAIRGIASVKGVPEIRDMTKALGRIFSYSVKGADEVKLGEELEIVRSYLQIQQLRFSGRFDVEFSVDADALDCRVPKMILQPLVENAIYHGLEPMLSKGRLNITGRLAGGKLEITIRDNGIGIEKDSLEGLKRRLKTGEESGEPGYTRIGVVNVGNRIRLMYGDGYGLDIESVEGGGTAATVTLPLGRAG